MAIRAPLAAREKAAEPAAPRAVDIEELWEHRSALADLSRRIVGDTATAEDVVQDTYLRALRNLDRIERRPSLIPWLTTVAKRRSIDMLRDRQRVAPVEDTPDTPARAEFDPLVRALAGDTVERVRAALSTLNERERRLLSLQVDAGLSLDELADDDGASVDSVRSVLARARAKLKTALVDSGVAVALPLGPLARLARRVRGRLAVVGTRAQQAPPSLAASLERLTDLVAAGAVTLALGAGPGAPNVALVDQPAADALPSSAAALATPGLSPAAAVTGSDALTPDGGGPTGVAPTSTAALHPVTAAVPAGIVPTGSDDADGPEDVGTDSIAVASGESPEPVVVVAGTRLRGCTTDCTVLLISEDGGRTWTRLAAARITGTTITLAPGFPADPRIVASGRQGVSISHDGGASFTRIAGPAVGAPVTLSPGFSSGDDRALIGSAPAWTYDDQSGTAVPFATAPAVSAPTYFAFDPAYTTSGRLFMAAGGAVTPEGTGAALYRCTARAGNDVCDEEAPLPGLTAISGLYASPHNALLAWGGTSALVSRDGGVSFATATTPAGTWITDVAEGGDGTMFASAAGGAAGAAAGETTGAGGVLRSVDGGTTWTPLPVPEPLARGAGAVAVLPSGRLLAAPLASAGGGLWCSADGGATWSGCET